MRSIFWSLVCTLILKCVSVYGASSESPVSVDESTQEKMTASSDLDFSKLYSPFASPFINDQIYEKEWLQLRKLELESVLLNYLNAQKLKSTEKTDNTGDSVDKNINDAKLMEAIIKSLSISGQSKVHLISAFPVQKDKSKQSLKRVKEIENPTLFLIIGLQLSEYEEGALERFLGRKIPVTSVSREGLSKHVNNVKEILVSGRGDIVPAVKTTSFLPIQLEMHHYAFGMAVCVAAASYYIFVRRNDG